MRRFLGVFLALAALLVFGSGCFSYSTLHTAKPIPQGEVRSMSAVSYYGASVDGESGDYPTVEGGARVGLTEDVDVGGKFYLFGVAGDVNWAFINEPDFVMSVNPYLAFMRFNVGDTDSSASWGVGLVNILADVVNTDVASVTVGLKPGFMYGFSSVSSELVENETDGTTTTAGSNFDPVVGGMAGVTLHLTNSFSIMPSFDVLIPVEYAGDLTLYNVGVSINY